MALPRRKPNRLPNYDYSQAGYYFITLCTKDKQPLFWQPSVGADIIRPPQGVPLSSIGRVVDEAIRAIPAHYPNVALDKFVVMPNHIHLILALAEPDGRIISAPTKPLSTVIGSGMTSILVVIVKAVMGVSKTPVVAYTVVFGVAIVIVLIAAFLIMRIKNVK